MKEKRLGQAHPVDAAGPGRAGTKGLTGDLDEGRVVTGTPEPGVPPERTAQPGFGPAPAQGGARIVGGDEAMGSADGPGPQVMAADTLQGDDVVNSSGEDLGEIKDIMLDVRSGRIAYAVLASSGFLGIGKKLFAIPWSALTLDADNRCFILDIDKETLSNAPGFDKEHWPSMGDRRWATEVHSYFHRPPYWEGRSDI